MIVISSHLVNMIAQTSPPPNLIVSPPWCWFLLGLIVSSGEYFLRKFVTKTYRFVILMLGVSAILMALILWRIEDIFGIYWPVFMTVDGALTLQILYWLGLAFTFVFWVRPMFYRVQLATMVESNEAETLTEIHPGQMGRVLYEGCSWQACCEHFQETIAPHQRVYVVGRKDNILFVIPEDLFRP
jgi:membrane protein implicated in regulation of membrane protease activity